jgi:hypothetical protein
LIGSRFLAQVRIVFSSTWLRASTFGTRGSQVQILPLRPAFLAAESITGNDMGNETLSMVAGSRRRSAPILTVDLQWKSRFHFENSAISPSSSAIHLRKRAILLSLASRMLVPVRIRPLSSHSSCAAGRLLMKFGRIADRPNVCGKHSRTHHEWLFKSGRRLLPPVACTISTFGRVFAIGA